MGNRNSFIESENTLLKKLIEDSVQEATKSVMERMFKSTPKTTNKLLIQQDFADF